MWRIYTVGTLRHRLSALVVALIIAGSPVVAMVCQFTCVAATAADPHVCCHHPTDAGAAITCASGECEHSDATAGAAALIAERVVVAFDASIANLQLPTSNTIAPKRLPWQLVVGVWKLTDISSRNTQLRI